jgi:peptidoglycan/xylan/chitin deacetylase (PgdA/CDA1 family)
MLLLRPLHIGLLGALAAAGFVFGQEPSPVPSLAPEKSKTPVRVATPVSFSWIHVNERDIALTFDDGPSPQLTPKLLDLLAARHIKATFFVIGENVAAHPEIVARAVREGHEIGNHSWDHPILGRMSDAGVRRELQKTDDAIREATGVRPTLLRPPYGSITARQKRWITQEFGYKIVLWDVDPLDWKNPGPMVVCNRILKMTRPGSIVLSHDIHRGTIEAMPATLDQLEAKGFKFVTVSQLISMAVPQAPKPVPVKHAEVPSKSAKPLATSIIPSG